MKIWSVVHCSLWKPHRFKIFSHYFCKNFVSLIQEWNSSVVITLHLITLFVYSADDGTIPLLRHLSFHSLCTSSAYGSFSTTSCLHLQLTLLLLDLHMMLSNDSSDLFFGRSSYVLLWSKIHFFFFLFGVIPLPRGLHNPCSNLTMLFLQREVLGWKPSLILHIAS